MFKYKKAVQVLNFFAIQADKSNIVLHKTNALKLMYFADKMHLRGSMHRTITEDDYKAKNMGPVADLTFDIIETIAQNREGKDKNEDLDYAKEFLNIEHDKITEQRPNASQSISIKSRKNIDKNVFSKSDIYSLEEVWGIFGDMVKDENQLINETHKYPEGNKFQEKGNYSQKIDIKELISTTTNGKDYLGDMDDKEIQDIKEVYEESYIGWRAIEGK